MDALTPREQLERDTEVATALQQRIASDPWFNFKAHVHQQEYISSILNGITREAWAICANRSGKSESAAYIGAGLARFGRKVPGYRGCDGASGPTKGWVISATAAASRSVVQPKLFDNGMTGGKLPFIPSREIKDFNRNENILYLKNGSIIEFKTAEAKTISLAGAGVDWIWIDEEVDKSKYDELTIRVEAGRPLLIFGACTLLPPEGQAGGVSWLFPEKIKPWMDGVHDRGYLLFGWSIYDNPYIGRDEIARLEGKYPIGSVERRIRLDGEWLPGMQGARAYTAFDSRIHVKPQGILIPRRPLCWTWDFNVEPMCSLIGQRDGELFRVHKELILDTDASIDQMVNWFREVYPTHFGEIWLYGDATGKNRNDAVPGGRSEWSLILQHMRTYGVPVRLKVPDTNPLVSDRINAVNHAHKDENGTIRVEIDPSCVELIADLEQVLRDARGGIKKVSDRKNLYFKRTHSSDALGYWINREEPVRNRPIGQQHEVTGGIKQPSYNRQR